MSGAAIHSVGLAADLLRAHVVVRTADAGLIAKIVVAEGEAEIDDDRLPLFRQQNIPRLQIAMHDALAVRMADRLGHLRDQFRGFAPSHASPFDPVGEASAGDELRDDEGRPVVHPLDVEHLDDADMFAQLGDLARFANVILRINAARFDQMPMGHFDRPVCLQFGIPHLKDDAIRTLPDRAHVMISPQ